MVTSSRLLKPRSGTLLAFAKKALEKGTTLHRIGTFRQQVTVLSAQIGHTASSLLAGFDLGCVILSMP